MFAILALAAAFVCPAEDDNSDEKIKRMIVRSNFYIDNPDASYRMFMNARRRDRPPRFAGIGDCIGGLSVSEDPDTRRISGGVRCTLIRLSMKSIRSVTPSLRNTAAT